jgi:cobalt-precorrin-5B (C1)-methyltransferase
MTASATEGGMTPGRRRGLRTGYTTGACAAAAAKAATIAWLTGSPPAEVTIDLPIGRPASFAIARTESNGANGVTCTVIKDAGDDPDVTHLAEICATVSDHSAPGIVLAGGRGVGTVTRPGLGLTVGGPSINPVPRQMILAAVADAAGPRLTTRGLRVEISVPRGEELARKTLNGRLGIVGGISILGTTGIVVPYSTAAWRASVEQAIDVAVANGQRWLVLTTGGRSEKFAMAQIDRPEIAFVEMGIFTGHALRRCQHHRVSGVTLGGMIGKLSKIAQGHLQTHVAGNQVDPAFLAAIAAEAGADAALVERLRAANTARHAQEIVQSAGPADFFDRLCECSRQACLRYVRSAFVIQVLLFDFDGRVLGRAGWTDGRPPATDGGRWCS